LACAYNSATYRRLRGETGLVVQGQLCERAIFRGGRKKRRKSKNFRSSKLLGTYYVAESCALYGCQAWQRTINTPLILYGQSSTAKYRTGSVGKCHSSRFHRDNCGKSCAHYNEPLSQVNSGLRVFILPFKYLWTAAVFLSQSLFWAAAWSAWDTDYCDRWSRCLLVCLLRGQDVQIRLNGSTSCPGDSRASRKHCIKCAPTLHPSTAREKRFDAAFAELLWPLVFYCSIFLRWLVNSRIIFLCSRVFDCVCLIANSGPSVQLVALKHVSPKWIISCRVRRKTSQSVSQSLNWTSIRPAFLHLFCHGKLTRTSNFQALP